MVLWVFFLGSRNDNHFVFLCSYVDKCEYICLIPCLQYLYISIGTIFGLKLCTIMCGRLGALEDVMLVYAKLKI